MKIYEQRIITGYSVYSLERPLAVDDSIIEHEMPNISHKKLDALAQQYKYSERSFLEALVKEANRLKDEYNRAERECDYNKLVAKIRSYLY